MNKSLIAGIVVLALIALGALYYFYQPEVVSADIVIDGDYAPGSITLENGATLTVNGNFTLDGTLACKGGGVSVIVLGMTTLNGDISCEGDAGDVSFVAMEGLTMSPDSKLAAGGNVQFVSDTALLLSTKEQIDAKFAEIGADSGAGIRVGPLVSSGEAVRVPQYEATGSEQRGALSFLRTNVAHAQAPVVIRGAMSVATPFPGVKRLVIFNFPGAAEVSISDFELSGPDGRKGEDDKGANCSAKGKPGEDAFRFTAVAPNLKVNNFTLNLGSGGAGGEAETAAHCDPARAEGGKGGASGNFKMIGSSSFSIEGALLINPGYGGAGGGAVAKGKDGAVDEKGGDATAVAGRGADNKKTLRMQGTVSGATNISVGDLVAGAGGWATADGGKGGDGSACGKAGQPGGKASATGGRGGDAKLTLSGGAVRADLAKDIGGAGGVAESAGGLGGNGGSCGSDKAGGAGGAGGSASTNEGKGGSGTNGNASDGANLDETGGDGGNGGDGCGPGNGGAGGAGDPKGKDGAKGKNLCVVEEKKTETTVGGGGTTAKPTIKVIAYGGKYLPVDQLIIESESGCDGGQDHWHAAEGIVTATDGSQVFDPGPQCGFGKVRDVPVMDYALQ